MPSMIPAVHRCAGRIVEAQEENTSVQQLIGCSQEVEKQFSGGSDGLPLFGALQIYCSKKVRQFEVEQSRCAATNVPLRPAQSVRQ